MSIYSEIKEVVTARDVAEYYGHQVSRRGMMRCPFHNDRNPSMKVDRNYICFGCQEKGDAIRLTEKLFNLPPYKATSKLIEDFHLNISVSDFGKSAPVKQKSANMQTSCKGKADRREALFRKAVRRIEDTYCKYFRMLNEWKIRYAPAVPFEELHPLYLEALMNTDHVEYLLDNLQYGSDAEKAALIIDKERDVKEIEKRIRESGSGDTGQT